MSDLVPVELGPEVEPDETANKTAAKIRHILQIYPRISPSMLHIALGPLTIKEWRPILDEMIAERIVNLETVYKVSPLNRSQSYTILSLNEAE